MYISHIAVPNVGEVTQGSLTPHRPLEKPGRFDSTTISAEYANSLTVAETAPKPATAHRDHCGTLEPNDSVTDTASEPTLWKPHPGQCQASNGLRY